MIWHAPTRVVSEPGALRLATQSAPLKRRDNLLMNDVDLRNLAGYVLWAAFGLAVVFGALAQRTRFCTMGAIADVVNMGD